MNRVEFHVNKMKEQITKREALEADYFGKTKGQIYQMIHGSCIDKYKFHTTKLKNFMAGEIKEWHMTWYDTRNIRREHTFRIDSSVTDGEIRLYFETVELIRIETLTLIDINKLGFNFTSTKS